MCNIVWILFIVGGWKGEREESERVSFYMGVRATLARECRSEISLKYVDKGLEFLIEIVDKHNKELTSIFLLIFVHLGSRALRYEHRCRETSRG